MSARPQPANHQLAAQSRHSEDVTAHPHKGDDVAAHCIDLFLN